ncbi:hypothetical protein [Flavobacterium sp. MK4S-17]|uniref:hypothetical protein n=1 Tax=Flavobacterium sp. MK4S-17 TaxID=2543737 RepID=UPI001915EBC0|nr:hypothetical protein [Flavobacterium sp. MK4S-17]
MKGLLFIISTVYGIPFTFNTHMAPRTFGTPVTLNNNVHVVKEMLGHATVKQTEVYAITGQAPIGKK